MKAFIARDSDGRLFLYSPNPPFKDKYDWVSISSPISIDEINQDLFPEVKWEDKEPTEINIEIVSKHQ